MKMHYASSKRLRFNTAKDQLNCVLKCASPELHRRVWGHMRTGFWRVSLRCFGASLFCSWVCTSLSLWLSLGIFSRIGIVKLSKLHLSIGLSIMRCEYINAQSFQERNASNHTTHPKLYRKCGVKKLSPIPAWAQR